MAHEFFQGDFYAPFVRSIVAPLWAHRERSPYLRHLRYLEYSPRRPLEVVRANQWRRLRKLLHHAADHVPYYRHRLREAGIDVQDIRTWDDFAAIPLLTKDDIRAHRSRMVADNIPPDSLHTKKTSGSTGVSLELVVDDESMQWKRACTVRHDQWTGWRLGERVGAVWGNPEYKKSWRGYVRNALLERFTYLDTLKMDEVAMATFYYQIRRRKPTLLYGHAHSLYLFARYLKKTGKDDIRPKGIISTAMMLHDFERRLIEEVFAAPVTNRYGCEEVSLIACECRAHNGLHLNLDTVVVEFIRDGRPAAPGEAGAIVVTDLTNRAMPFIRYKVGDVGVPSGRTCYCGCTYPLMESVEGRIADYVLTPEGEFISGISLTENFAMHLSGVKQMQIVQERLDHLVLRLVQGDDFTDGVLTRIAELVSQRFGTRMGHAVEFVEAIEQESSGKYRFCISRLQEQPF
jgi:phenylacetate-CoA ligase